MIDRARSTIYIRPDIKAYLRDSLKCSDAVDDDAIVIKEVFSSLPAFRATAGEEVKQAGDDVMIHSKPDMHEQARDALTLAERFLLWNVRAWACSCRGQRLPAEPVRRAFENIGIPAAAVAIDAAMTHLVLATRRPLAVNCPPHKGLSCDETMLLAAAAAAQKRDRRSAKDLLGQVLPGPALNLVVDALQDLGTWLATVGILLPFSDLHAAAMPSRGTASVASPTLH